MHQPKLLIIGEARHGKDELMQYLAKNYGYLGWSSSYFAACHFMVERMRERTGIIYDSVEDCYADRQSPEHRQIWFEEIERFNDPDRTKMANTMLSQRPVYNGMRSDKEFYANKAANTFDFIIYIDAKERLVREGKYKPDPTLKIPKSEAHAVLYNNGTLAEFHRKGDALMKIMGIPRITS